MTPPRTGPSAERGTIPREQVEQVLALVRARGGRVTTARRSLLEALFASSGHCTAEDLAAIVQAKMPDVHISTIYRNLDELERLGVLVHTHLGHGPASYHLASSPHGHLVCERCGETVEAPAEMFAGLARSARKRFGFRIDPRHFAVLGACAACVAAEPAPVSFAGRRKFTQRGPGGSLGDR